jgi:tumor protein p53-inducible protein 3
LIQDFENTILPHFSTKTLVPIIDSEFGIDNIRDAHEHVESNKTIGKVLLKVSNDAEENKAEERSKQQNLVKTEL